MLVIVGTCTLGTASSKLAAGNKDFRGTGLSSYNAALSSWSSTGSAAFAAVLPSSTYALTVTLGGVGSVTVTGTLTAQHVPTPLSDTGGLQSNYSTLYYTASLPTWPSTYSIAAGAMATFVFGGMSVQAPLWQCADTQSCPATPGGRRLLQTTACPQGLQTTRTFAALTEITLDVTPGSAPSVAEDSCEPASLLASTRGGPVTSQPLQTDGRSWVASSVGVAASSISAGCGAGLQGGITSFPSLPAGANFTVTVRSAADPYLFASHYGMTLAGSGLSTAANGYGAHALCTADFGPTKDALVRSAIPGVIVGALILFAGCVSIAIGVFAFRQLNSAAAAAAAQIPSTTLGVTNGYPQPGLGVGFGKAQPFQPAAYAAPGGYAQPQGYAPQQYSAAPAGVMQQEQMQQQQYANPAYAAQPAGGQYPAQAWAQAGGAYDGRTRAGEQLPMSTYRDPNLY